MNQNRTFFLAVAAIFTASFAGAESCPSGDWAVALPGLHIEFESIEGQVWVGGWYGFRKEMHEDGCSPRLYTTIEAAGSVRESTISIMSPSNSNEYTYSGKRFWDLGSNEAAGAFVKRGTRLKCENSIDYVPPPEEPFEEEFHMIDSRTEVVSDSERLFEFEGDYREPCSFTASQSIGFVPPESDPIISMGMRFTLTDEVETEGLEGLEERMANAPLAYLQDPVTGGYFPMPIEFLTPSDRAKVFPQPYWASTQSPVAYRSDYIELSPSYANASPGEEARGLVNLRMVTFEAQLDAACGGTYEVEEVYLDSKREPDSSCGMEGEWTRRKTVMLEPEPDGRAPYQGSVPVKPQTLTQLIEIRYRPVPGCDMVGGSSSQALGSIRHRVSLGAGSKPGFPGFVYLEADSVEAALDWSALSTSGLVEIRDPADGALLQLAGATMVADLSAQENGFVISLYGRDSIDVAPGSGYAGYGFLPDAVPVKKFVYLDPDATESGTSPRERLHILVYAGSAAEPEAVHEFRYDAALDEWMLHDSRWERVQRLRKRELGGGLRSEMESVETAEGEALSGRERIYRTFVNGDHTFERLVEERRYREFDAAGDGLLATAFTETFVYRADSSDPAEFGLLVERRTSEGEWERYEFPDPPAGIPGARVSRTVRPVGNNAPGSPSEINHVVDTIVRDADLDGNSGRLYTIVEFRSGLQVVREMHFVYDDGDQTVRVRRAFLEPGDLDDAAWESGPYSEVIEWTHRDELLEGRPSRIDRPEGVRVQYAYHWSVDPLYGNALVLRTEVERGVIDGDPDQFVPGFRTLSREGSVGGMLERRSYDLEGDPLLVDWEIHSDPDPAGRPRRIDHFDGTFETMEYDCCGLAWRIGRTGVQTYYGYDPDGVAVYASERGITTRTERRYEEDAASGLAGEKWTTVRTGTDGSEMVTGSVLMDGEGRALLSGDGLNNITRYAYSVDAEGGRVRTTTLPDGLSRKIRRTARDGRLESLRGEAVRPVRYEYGVSPDAHDGIAFNATYERRIGLLEGGEDSADIETVWRDMLGRVYKIETPSPDGAGMVATLRFHDLAGRVVRQVDPDGVTYLYAYDPLGREQVAALDVDHDGVIDCEGPDEVLKVRTNYELIDDGIGGVAPARAKRIYVCTDVEEELLSERIRFLDRLEVRNSGPGWSVDGGIDLAGGGDFSVRSIDAHGVEATRAYLNGYLVSDSLRSSDASLRVEASFGYDPHGRLAYETGRSGQTTTYQYHGDDSIRRILGPSSSAGADDGRSLEMSAAWDLVGGGIVRTTNLPDGSSVVRKYSPRGALMESSGSGAGEVPFALSYDHAGRVSRLTTWSAYPDRNDAVVTKWDYNPAGLLESKTYDLGGADEQGGPRFSYSPGGRLVAREWARLGQDGTRLRTDYRYELGADDWSGRLAAIEYGDATPDVGYVYDRLGRIVRVSDGSGRRDLEYEGLDLRVAAMRYREGPLLAVALGYAWNGERVRSRVLEGPLGFAATEHYGHDLLGRMDSVNSDRVTVRLSRLEGSDLVDERIHSLDGEEMVRSAWTFDLRDEMERVTWSSAAGESGSTAYGTDALGRRTHAEGGDGRYWSWEFDRFGQLLSADKYIREGSMPDPSSDPTVPGYRLHYLHDSIGNRTSTAMNGRSASWQSNRLNQSRMREVPQSLDVRGESAAEAVVTVDGAPADRDGAYFWRDVSAGTAGARIEATLDDGDPGTVDPRHVKRVAVAVGPDPETFSYDRDGNLTADGRRSYEWDGENRLSAVDVLSLDGSGDLACRVEYGYDSWGRRVSRTQYEPDDEGGLIEVSARLFLFDGWNPVAELGRVDGDGAFGVVRTCAWGPDLGGGLDTAGGIGGLLVLQQGESSHLPVYDGAGNVLAVLDADTGQIDAEFEYGPFGETLRATGLPIADFPFRFSTKYADPATGLLYFGHRNYDPDTGRWLNRDPSGESGGLNLYGYLGNGPVNAVDPLGLDTYAIDGTYANIYDPTTKWRSTNVSDFVARLDRNEWRRYYGGPGTSGLTHQRGGKLYNGVTGAETFDIVQQVVDDVCKDRRWARRTGREFEVNLIGWSRGATAAIWVAKELQSEGCDCGDGRKQPVPVNFLGLYDAVEMIPAGPFTAGHRVPEWLPGDQGPPNTVPGNVQDFFHAYKTGGPFIRSSIPLPTTHFGHAGEFAFPTREPYRVDGRLRSWWSDLSDHGEIGVSPGATEAHADMLNAAAQAGLPINTSDPYVHLR